METLVLDTAYQPVARVPWQRAVTLWFQKKIEIVEEYEDKEIRSVTFSLKMPAVVRFVQAIRRKKRAIKFSRHNVYARDKGRCQYCGDKVKREESTYDHVVPRAQGGKTTWDNVVIACVPCNQRKGRKTPKQAGMKLRSKPGKPKKLPEVRVTVTWRKGMPEAWRDWLYWTAELEE